MSLYLLHFDRPYEHASHYLGFSEDEASIDSRVKRHRSGHGSPLVAAAVSAGIDVELVRVWPYGDRSEERRLKGHGSPRYCPRCNPGWETRGVAPLPRHEHDTGIEL